MIDINKEAEEYAPVQNQCMLDVIQLNQRKQEDFIAGHNSKATQAKIIQAQIDVLKEIDVPMTGYITTQIYSKIGKLRQQLKELKNE
jgi:hypothetical protein